MISISHWGMFEVRPAFLVLPAGYTVKDLEAARAGWNCPDGFIEIVRDRNA